MCFVYLPDGSVDYFVEQVVMQVGGCRKAQKLHREGGDEAQSDASSAQDDKNGQMVRVTLWFKHKILTSRPMSKYIFSFFKV